MNGKRVLITGSSRGIGHAIAKEFIENQYHVFLNCLKNKTLMENLMDDYKMINPNVRGFCADVSNYEETKKMFDEIGGIDILINNAGISQVGLFNETKPSDFAHIIDTNLYSVLNCTHLAINGMIKRKSGVIINISSVWGNVGASCEALYAATKGAVNLFTKSMAKELGPSNIRVNAIACGVVKTEMNDFLNADEKSALMENIPLMRFADPYEIGRTALFLASDDSKYITGQIITVDGGFC